MSRLDGNEEMNLKSKTYMKGEEFKARQLWLPFVDAVGVVLQVLEPVKAAAWDWFKQWKKELHGKQKKTSKEVFQFPLPFEPLSIYTI